MKIKSYEATVSSIAARISTSSLAEAWNLRESPFSRTTVADAAAQASRRRRSMRIKKWSMTVEHENGAKQTWCGEADDEHRITMTGSESVDLDPIEFLSESRSAIRLEAFACAIVRTRIDQ